MNVELSPDQRVLLESLVARGGFASVDEAVHEGVALLVSRETLKQQIQTGIDEADRGEVADHDTVFGQLRAMALAGGHSPRGK